MLAYPEVASLRDALFVSSDIYADLAKYTQTIDTIVPSKSLLSTIFDFPLIVSDHMPRGRMVCKHPNLSQKARPISHNNLNLTPAQLYLKIKAGTVKPVRDGFVEAGTLVWFRSGSGPVQVTAGSSGHSLATFDNYSHLYSIAKPGVRQGVAQVQPSVDYRKVDLQQVRLADGYLVAPSNPPAFLWFYNSETQAAEKHDAKSKVSHWRMNPHLWFRNEPIITKGKFLGYTPEV
ncbi:hypothetical protein CPT_Percy3 [Caulobacter phage Percy]|uniref:Uncharacterized protein n=1 Tax=Caulobacter phage Percy TaxID=1701809 RepID=A0A0M4S5P6_9CAUD|nr:hypothetical protein CPT_Percy3 [Caulobacter phage Percy]ALF01637.1 hypothetical protein CPT_Percy3 [Caulobacter phage Percy]